MNRELELFKLITLPDKDDADVHVQWVDEFGWINDDFVVWVSKWWWNDFITRLTQIFGYSLFDGGGFDAKVQEDCICFVLSDIIAGYGINLEDVFSKEEYKH